MLWLIPLALLLLVLYWELVIAEGVHLGPRVVAWLYDLVASRYDRIKSFDPAFEDEYLGRPLAEALVEVERPKVLDVAAGNGRVARTLLRQTAFDGVVVNLDLAARMLADGRQATRAWPARAHWLRSLAAPLPFADNTFDAVTCIEALEFFPDAGAALAECVRVLRPGGRLVASNRVGGDAWLVLGKTMTRPAFERRLAKFPLQGIRVQRWQMDYDLAWARKALPPDN
jgi:SAM-dependent methyltransferase